MFTKSKQWVGANGQCYNIKVIFGDIILSMAKTVNTSFCGYFVDGVPVKKGTNKYNKYIVQFIEMHKMIGYIRDQ